MQSSHVILLQVPHESMQIQLLPSQLARHVAQMVEVSQHKRHETKGHIIVDSPQPLGAPALVGCWHSLRVFATEGSQAGQLLAGH